jgi:DNA-binding MarR family transcriptional regulator
MSIQADISQIDFAVINMLNAGERISCKELARMMDLSTSRCSRIVERLLRKGYVVRKPNPDDRRAIEVSLTAKGIRLKKNIENLKTQCEKRILSAIEPGDIEIVRQGIGILQRSLRIQQ